MGENSGSHWQVLSGVTITIVDEGAFELRPAPAGLVALACVPPGRHDCTYHSTPRIVYAMTIIRWPLYCEYPVGAWHTTMTTSSEVFGRRLVKDWLSSLTATQRQQQMRQVKRPIDSFPLFSPLVMNTHNCLSLDRRWRRLLIIQNRSRPLLTRKANHYCSSRLWRSQVLYICLEVPRKGILFEVCEVMG